MMLVPEKNAKLAAEKEINRCTISKDMMLCVLDGGAQQFSPSELRLLLKVVEQWQNVRFLLFTRAVLGDMLKGLGKLYPNVLGAKAKKVLGELGMEPNLDKVAPRSVADVLLNRLHKLSNKKSKFYA